MQSVCPESGRSLAYLPALSYRTSPDLGPTLGSVLGEGHRQAGAWTEVVTRWGGLSDPEKVLSLEAGPWGTLSLSLQGCPGAEGAEQGQRTLEKPGEDRPVATRWECYNRGIACSWRGRLDN